MLRLRMHGLVSLAAVATLVLSGCGSTVKLDEAPVESRTPTAVGSQATGPGKPATASGAAGGAVPQSQVATVSLPGAAGSGNAALGRVVYFDFDSFTVKDEFRNLIDAHAKVLAAQRSKRLVIEGHTDAVGSAASNLALSDRRAESVAKALTEYFDVPPENLVVQGYGESELLVNSLGNERANRRVAVRIITALLQQTAR